MPEPEGQFGREPAPQPPREPASPPASQPVGGTDCLLCSAQRLTEWHLEDDDCWVADCIVCMTPMVVWRTHGLPDGATEVMLLARLEHVAAARYGVEGFYIDGERRKIPDHWHAHARPSGGFFDPKSPLYGRYDAEPGVDTSAEPDIG